MHVFKQIITIGIVLAAVTVTPVIGEQLTLETGKYSVTKALAKDISSNEESEGAVQAKRVVFDQLKPARRYDLLLSTADDKIIHLLDTAWHISSQSAAGKLEEEDRKAINEIISSVKTFTNHNTILSINGSADRAVAVMELYRDTDFHDRKGDEIIWRIEVWYFENQAGGWAKVQQQNRVIERVRFTSKEEFEKRRRNTIFLTRAEGVSVVEGKGTKIALP